jgi:glycerate kinase
MVFGPQKGASPSIAAALDAALYRFSEVVAWRTGKDLSGAPGAGAAGGLGFGFLAFLNSDIKRGVDVVQKAVGLEAAMENADFVITGEGKLDHQTVMGKAPDGVAGAAKKHGAAVIAFCGSAPDSASICNDHGIDAYFPILPMPMTLREAMEPETAENNLEAAARQVFRLVGVIMKKASGRGFQ